MPRAPSAAALPPALELRFAPSTERLLEALAADLAAAPIRDPLVRECILVQSRGMQRWLEQQLSAEQGVLLDAWFPFPQALVGWLWRRAVGAAAGGSWDPGAGEDLRWAVAGLLPGLLERPELAALRRWLDAQAQAGLSAGSATAEEGGHLLALAQPIARVLDRYLFERPDLLELWEQSPGAAPLPPDLAGGAEEAAWQAPLWRALLAERPQLVARHPARRARELLQRLESWPVDGEQEPPEPPERHELRRRLPRLSVFGLSALSATYLRVLGALARHLPVRVYTLAPSPEDSRRVWDLGLHARENLTLSLPAPPTALLAEQLSQLDSHPLLRSQAGALRGFQYLGALAGARMALLEDDAANRTPSDSSDRALSPSPSPIGGGGRGERADSYEPTSASPPSPPSLLASLQADIAADRLRRLSPRQVERLRQGEDRSLLLHSCHSPLREAELLRDQLLDAFDQLPDLEPQDVVVMVPDLERYAPYLQAALAEGAAPIPCRVADQPRGELGAELAAFLQALGLLEGRLSAPQVMDLLALAPLQAALGLDAEGLDWLREQVAGCGIHWGLDGAQREALGQPPLEAGTWRWGLARLYLGWAAPGDGQSLLQAGALLPHAAAGERRELLAILAGLVELLERWRRELAPREQGLAAWAEDLRRAAHQLFGGARAPEPELAWRIEARLRGLATAAAEGGFERPLGLAAVRRLLEGMSGEDGQPSGFLEGAVTVCGLQPMRALPFRVLALVGLNAGALPRSERPPAYDLAGQDPRLGDLTAQDRDRLLFLEALCCARERLILSWTGQDPQSDADLPPSVLVAELQDTLRAMLGGHPSASADAAADDAAAPLAAEAAEGAEAADQALPLQRHLLHAYGRRYYPASPSPRWFSYQADGAAAPGAPGLAPRPPLLAQPLPPPEMAVPRILDLAELRECWQNPAQHFLRRRLGVRMARETLLLAEREPQALDGLTRWQAGEALLRLLEADPAAAAGEPSALARAETLLRAQGLLPLGSPGRLEFQRLLAPVGALARLAGQLRSQAPRGCPVDLALALPDGELRLRGALKGLQPQGLVATGYGRLNGRRSLSAWLEHLALCSLVQEGRLEGIAPASWILGRTDKEDQLRLLHLREVPQAPRVLAGLAEGALANLRRPLAFYPQAAAAYARSLGAEALAAWPGAVDETLVTAALEAAAKAFVGEAESSTSTWGAKGDLLDPDLDRILGDSLPWDEDGEPADPTVIQEFQALCARVHGPLLQAQESLEGAAAEARGQALALAALP